MVKLFFSYSHKDEELRNELETHLALLQRQGVISSWHDRRITAGGDIHGSVSNHLEDSWIVLLLVSANFLASDYCYEKEMTRALEKHEEGTAVVIPVILHPCDWHSAPFGRLRATPTDGKPVSMHANQHEALAIIARDVREAANGFDGDTESSPMLAQGGVDADSRTSGPRSTNLRIKRQFDDHERDEFLEDTYEYIARFFSGSLEELAARDPQIKTRFKRTTDTSFSAAIYENGNRVAQCAIWNGGGDRYGLGGIAFSHSGEGERNSFNEQLTVTDDGYTLQLKPLGMQFHDGSRDKALSQQGAAEYYWELLIRPLQH
ncbi:hypothetical protein KBTX_03206 [wastewater metagenome]|uniref:TIR domain-containing protein n=2 Tax=unclassified sequences TaxID=12908 RepID=A0A5B8RIK3_9ZZZZ|nr:toll/interleukin-1 receptor domain-containing protein [Arhodomonas sp. KWT]QEA06865.1 hypothetical protein KBTEX_03206 [uncultured organism]